MKFDSACRKALHGSETSQWLVKIGKEEIEKV